MRIANQTLYDNITTNLGRVTEAMWKANRVVSTTKRINQISDDPVGLVTVLELRGSLAGIQQMGKNIETGRTWLNAGESALTQTGDLLTNAKSLCVRMVTSTVSASERRSAAQSVDGYLRQLLFVANTDVGGRYIFSGTKTDTTPFSFDDEDNPTTMVYSGNDTPFSIKIGESLTVEVGRDGEDAFGSAGNSVFDVLIDLKSALQNNDVGGIQAAMDDMDYYMDSVNSLVSNTGAKTLRLEAKDQILQDLNLSYTERKSVIEDADIAEAIMDLSGKELAYQAALASSSKVMSLSLVDYL